MATALENQQRKVNQDLVTLGQQVKQNNKFITDDERYLGILEANPNADPKEIALIQSELAKHQAIDASLQQQIDELTGVNRTLTDKIMAERESAEKAAEQAKADPASSDQKAVAAGNTTNAAGTTTSSDQKTVAANDTSAVAPNPNGDPNPNAVITPANPNTQPSNLQVAKVDITGDSKPAVPPPPPPAAAVVPQGESKINDWRVKLSLADGSNYLYNDPDVSAKDSKHILKPLHDTKGIVFPYMPAISLSYRANYDPAEVTHSNYKLQFYRGSSVDDITITAEFTAQDTTEAKYLLAVIHFFRSVTKMFYGQDQGPVAGTPPPMCFLSGLGAYQFNKHPIVISSFSYSLPTDVDYIRTEAMIPWAGSGINDASSKDNTPASSPNFFQKIRLKMSGIKPQAAPPKPEFKSGSLTQASAENTYVPTKMQITLGAHVIVSRADISKNFSLKDYASGKLTKEKGIW